MGRACTNSRVPKAITCSPRCRRFFHSFARACYRRRPSLFGIKAPPRGLDLAASHLFVHAPALRTFGRSRRLARWSRSDSVVHDILQPRQRVIAILVETAKTLRLDDDHAFGGDAPVAMRQQPLLGRVRQRRRTNVESQMHGALDLVDVLPARAL